MDLFTWSIVLIASIFFLVKSADLFTDRAEKIGQSMGMTEFIIGVFIVAIGTSLPELVTSILAVIRDEGGMAAGNVFGSVIANILLGLGLVSVITRRVITFKSDLFYADMPILVGGLFMSWFIFNDLTLSRGEAIILLLTFVVYIRYLLDTHQNGGDKSRKIPFKTSYVIVAALSLGVLILASNYTITAALKVAEMLGVGSSEIASSVIAVGTSLPEIVVAFVAAKKGKFEMLIGNIMGSNIFNIFVVTGAFGLLKAQTSVTIELLTLTIPFAIASVMLYWIVSKDTRITKPESGLMVLMYILFIGKLFNFF